MTLGTLVVSIGVVALILTLVTGFVLKRVENWVVSFLQHFVGALFIFSGWVKAVDPLGTAYKMEQYFGEFETTFEGTWFSFLAPLFPKLSEMSTGFSVFMIVFEIVLGVMILIGLWRKLASWLFLLLVVFFTFLTGFTYLTGYVPNDVNFFQFGKWGPYVSTNMKVTDCGCFGDFIKLDPKISFFKDLVLLVPSIVFVIYHKKMHQLFSALSRTLITTLATVGLLIYCFSNYSWDIPHTDFRPFKEGVNVGERKALEEDALINAEVIAYELTNKETKEVVTLPYQELLERTSEFSTDTWEYEQIKEEPAVPTTKISDFEVSDTEGNDVTADLLSDPNYSFMIVAYKLYGSTSKGTEIRYDTTYAVDTIIQVDTVLLEEKIASIDKRQVTVDVYDWDNKYLAPWKGTVNLVMNEALSVGVKVAAVTSYADPAKLEDFKAASESNYPFYLADDILLKTIVRSNPGVVLLKNGEVIKKWHHKKLPSFEEIKAAYMK